MQTPSDIAVIPRDIHFRTESARGAAWLGGDPVATAVFNALSLTFPDGERLFIDSVRAFRSRSQGKLAEDARAFIAQEAIHSREHASLNAHLDRSHYPVERIERLGASPLGIPARAWADADAGRDHCARAFHGHARGHVRLRSAALGRHAGGDSATVALARNGGDRAQGGGLRRVQRGDEELGAAPALPLPRALYGAGERAFHA